MAFIRSFSDLRALTLLVASLLLGHAQITMAAMDQDQLVDLMQSGGAVLMIRHALAPGTGDPDHFKIGDCSTQRNLNEEGRRQASDIGDWLRVHGIQQARVYSSQWCRCLDTARLLKMGSVNELPALNSFYERPEDREPNLAALRAFIVENTQRGQLIILVTHQVTISGITNEWTDSGHAKLVRLDGDGHIVLQGSLAF